MSGILAIKKENKKSAVFTRDRTGLHTGRSISVKLFRAIFGFYCVTALTITFFHLVYDYFSIKEQMRQSILRYQHSLEETLAKEVWHLDRTKNKATLEGITRLPFVVGASVHLPDGSVFNRIGAVLPDEEHQMIWDEQSAPACIAAENVHSGLFVHAFDLFDTSIAGSPETIGHVHLYSAPAAILRQLRALAVPIVVAAFVKTAILWVIFIWVVNRRLGRPLRQLVAFVGELPVEKDEKDAIGKEQWDDINELELLEQTLAQLSQRLIHTLNALKEESGRHRQTAENLKVINEKIEITIQERTLELAQSRDELQQAFNDLKIAQSRILQQEKMASIGQLAAGVAHEINNPMGFILSNLNTLGKYTGRLVEFQDAQLDVLKQLSDQPESLQAKVAALEALYKSLKIKAITADISDLLAESVEGGERVKEIVQNMKSFARLDEGEQQLADLNQCLESTLNIVWNELKYRCTVTKDYGELPQIPCNPGQLNQVFLNLLINAGQAIEDKGEIHISTQHVNGFVEVIVEDTGSGIEADKLSRIFEPFFTTKDIGKGTGLGLSIVYDIVKSHGGVIEVESEVGCGTRFTVRLPVTKEAPATG